MREDGQTPLLNPNAFAGASLIPILVDGEEPDFIGPRGLWIHGEVGTGKTFIMDLFFNSIPVKSKKRIHFHHFMHSVHSKINDWHRLNPMSAARQSSKGHVTALVARELMREAWLICFDEFQVTDVATAVLMRQLFAHMFRMGAVIVATSNRIPDELYRGGWQKNIYGPFVELIKDRCEIYDMRSKQDYRDVIAQGYI